MTDLGVLPKKEDGSLAAAQIIGRNICFRRVKIDRIQSAVVQPQCCCQTNVLSVGGAKCVKQRGVFKRYNASAFLIVFQSTVAGYTYIFKYIRHLTRQTKFENLISRLSDLKINCVNKPKTVYPVQL